MSDSDHKRKIVYFQEIKELIQKLNQQSSEEEVRKLLKVIKQKDTQFMEAFNMNCQGHALLTRHGECNNWGQKRFGLNPNSPLSQDCIMAMVDTHKLTEELFYFDNEIPIVRISPMVRAKQTASLVLPKNRKYDLDFENFLTENSSKPASSYIRNLEQLNRGYQSTSLFENFTKVLTYKLSSIFYGQQAYDELQKLSTQADQQIFKLKASQEQKIYRLLYKSITRQMTKKQKTKMIKITIKSQPEKKRRDLWFFGHSKNLKEFFKNQLGEKESFVFGQTRRIYIVRSNENSLHYFSPPYKFHIDQSNGRVKVQFAKKQKVFHDFQ